MNKTVKELLYTVEETSKILKTNSNTIYKLIREKN